MTLCFVGMVSEASSGALGGRRRWLLNISGIGLRFWPRMVFWGFWCGEKGKISGVICIEKQRRNKNKQSGIWRLV